MGTNSAFAWRTDAHTVRSIAQLKHRLNHSIGLSELTAVEGARAITCMHECQQDAIQTGGHDRGH